MACRIMILFLIASQFTVHAEKSGNVILEKARVKVDCLSIQFHDAGFPDLPHLDAEYFLRFEVTNYTDENCVVEPMRFRILDADDQQYDAQEVFIRYRQVEEEQSETIRPGETWEYAIVFGRVQLEESRPAQLYYKSHLLGDLTR